MKMSKRITLFMRVLNFMLITAVALVCGTAIGQEEKKKSTDEFTLEEITVTAQFQETNLQQTPIAITAITGDTLETQNILSVKDLGLVIPGAQIKEQGNAYGPNAQIYLRGIGQWDFIPALEPGVGVYVDDIYQETLVGSTMDLLDLERIEVLRGPQGTLFGKNSLGGSIRLISKTPRGDNTGHLQVTYGDYNRIDFSGSYDFTMIEDKLFARLSASSRKIDGYMDVLDFTCQMKANGTPELAGSFPQTLLSNKMNNGNCKIGEKGGSQSDAAKLMLRYLPTDKMEINFGIDYTDMTADQGAETLLKGLSPDRDDSNNYFNTPFQDLYITPEFGINILGDLFVTGDPFTVYESWIDPLNGTRWPNETNEDHTNIFARVDYDFTDNVHLKGIFGYREYQQVFATTNSTPLSLNAYLIDMEHDQTSYEVRLYGTAFDERLDWTTGLYYFDSNHSYGGFVSLGSYGYILPPYGFANNDYFTTESKSAFAHFVFGITEDLSLTVGGRYTDEDKTFAFDHTDFLTIADPLQYGEGHTDWKVNLDYQFTEDIMAYAMVSTGYRSEGAVPRPWNYTQLESIGKEEVTAYEVGAKTQFFDNRLRVNASAYLNVYDPRQLYVFGGQCNDWQTMEEGETPIYVNPWGVEMCPAGTDFAGGPGTYASVYISGPGKTRGFELEMTARPLENLDMNASFGYYRFKTDVDDPTLPSYVHPDYKAQPEFTYSMGAQYRINFKSGSMLIPRLDMFYQGEYNNNGPQSKPIEPYHVVPDYTLFNARLTYMTADAHWSLSLEVQNLFDKFYWIQLTQERSDDGTANSFGRTGVPGRPRSIGLTLRYNIF